MKMRFAAMAAIVAAICTSGCSKANQQASSNDGAPVVRSGGDSTSTAGSWPQASGADATAIRTAIEDHVRNDRSVNMDMMEMSVDSVSVNGDQAHAEAAFRLKRGGTGMAMTYFLERHADGWVVTRSQPSDGQFIHPPTDGAPSAMPPSAGEPAMPDLTDFLRSHPSDDKN
jgi:hypothetical protein